MRYTITPKGLVVLRSAALWGFSSHARELLAMAERQLRVENARQFMPPHSLHTALFTLVQLELVEGPPVEEPRDTDESMLMAISRRLNPLRA